MSELAEFITSQRSPIPGRESDMEENHAGGYVFKLDKWKTLDRFLMLGSSDATYYATAEQTMAESIGMFRELVEEDYERVLKRIIVLDQENRIYKRKALFFALAYVLTYAKKGSPYRSVATYLVAMAVLATIRTASDFFSFLSDYRTLNDGKIQARHIRKVINEWYGIRSPEELLYQLMKYRNRAGFTHRDVIRLGHPKPNSVDSSKLFRWAARNEMPRDPVGIGGGSSWLTRLKGFDEFQSLGPDDAQRAVDLIRMHDLSHEMVPRDLMKSPGVWTELLKKMPMMATVRNLARLTSMGLFDSDKNIMIVENRFNQDAILKSRIHPMYFLNAKAVYSRGRGVKGSLTWDPNHRIEVALSRAFLLAFKNVKPTGKRISIGLDVSGSMYSEINGMALNCMQAAAAMVSIINSTESDVHIGAFCHYFTGLGREEMMNVDSALRTCERLGFGGTDCAIPMLQAIEDDLKVDAFIVLTDCETWAGGIHPIKALDMYKSHSGIDAKLIVCAMTATNFSIADPSREDNLDVVGFDTKTPQLIADFIS